jgi:hypothetical protein
VKLVLSYEIHEGLLMVTNRVKLRIRVSPPTAMCLGLRPLQSVIFISWPRWAISPKVAHESQGEEVVAEPVDDKYVRFDEFFVAGLQMPQPIHADILVKF